MAVEVYVSGRLWLTPEMNSDLSSRYTKSGIVTSLVRIILRPKPHYDG